jgi:hypothetical protein
MKKLIGDTVRAIPILLGVALLAAVIDCGDDRPSGTSPSVELVATPADTVFAGVPQVIVWSGAARVGRIDGYYYGLNDPDPKFWTTADRCTLRAPPLGRNVFFVTAQDEAGRRSEAASCAFTVKPSDCALSAATIDFGPVEIGRYRELSFTLTNPGATALSGEISEACGDFEIVSGGGSYNLDGGAWRETVVRFTPGVWGAAACTIGVGHGGCPDVVCYGEGCGDSCAVSPPTLDFGTVPIGSFSDLAFVIGNVGCIPLDGEFVMPFCGDYRIVAGRAYSLAPGESQEVTVRFAPSTCAASECSIAAYGGCARAVLCTGSGVGDFLSVAPMVLEFGGVAAGTNSTKSFWIRNYGCGTEEGTVSENCETFSFESPPSWSLASMESTEVQVTFSPRTCDDEGWCWVRTGNPRADSVLCIGSVGCGCWVSDEDGFFDFGCLESDQNRTEPFDIKNLSCDTLSFDVRLVSNPQHGFSVTVGGGDQVLPPNAEHQVVVRFGVAEESSYSGVLDLGRCGQIRLAGKRCGGSDPPLPTMDVKCRP